MKLSGEIVGSPEGGPSFAEALTLTCLVNSHRPRTTASRALPVEPNHRVDLENRAFPQRVVGSIWSTCPLSDTELVDHVETEGVEVHLDRLDLLLIM